MKKPLKNEGDMLDLVNKIQAQLAGLEKKIDTLIDRALPQAKPVVNNETAKTNDQSRGRVMHQAICADCKKECTIPFKPSGDRPVYCKDCFSRRKVISMSGMKLDPKPAVVVPELKIKEKKAVKPKKPAAKKKTVPKKK